jgi:hypothetical protein
MEALDVSLLLDPLGVPAKGLLAFRVGSLESLVLTDINLAEILIRKDEKGEVENLQMLLRELNLAGNDLTAFNLEQVVGHFPALERLNLGSNRLEEMSRNVQMELVCNRVLHA